MDANESIRTALEALQIAEDDGTRPPAMVVFPPDSGKYIVGNRDGYVQLAITSLKAAQGNNQPFKNLSWLAEDDPDWAIAGLEYDASAHVYLPPKQTVRGKIFGAIAPLGLVVCLLVGICTIVYGIIRLFMR